MLESALKEQLKGIFAGLEANFTFDISVSSSHENKTELLELLGDVADCSTTIGLSCTAFTAKAVVCGGIISSRVHMPFCSL